MAFVKSQTHIPHSMWGKNDISCNFDVLKYYRI